MTVAQISITIEWGEAKMDLCTLGAVELRDLLATREVSATEVMSAHLERIDAVNPSLNALVDLRPELAMEQAERADELAASGTELPALHGLPMAVKDTANAAGFITTHGSLRHRENLVDRDDLHVGRLRGAGALVLGKSNIPEYAAGSHSFNRVYGATRNPHDTSKIAGGSSGGAAAALAAGLVPLADGSDMGGSLRNPAALCGVVGMRPTPGLIPNTGASLFDPLGVVGPMGRSPRDVALMLSVMSGPDAIDPLSDQPRTEERLPRVDLRGLRIAVSPELGGIVPVDPQLSASVRRAAEALEAAGAQIVEAMPDLTGSEEAFRTLRAAEFFAAFGADKDQGVEEFVDFLAGNIEQGRNLGAQDVLRAQQRLSTLVRGAEDFFRDVDLFISPTTSIPAFDVEQHFPSEYLGRVSDDYLDWMRATWLFTPLNIPALSLPGGLTDEGLPVGLHLMSAHGTDARLLALADAVGHLLPAPSVPALIGA